MNLRHTPKNEHTPQTQKKWTYARPKKNNEPTPQTRKKKMNLLHRLEKKLDVDPQRDDDASPMSTYRCMSRPT